MSGPNVLRRSFLIGVVLTVLLLLGAPAALAADESSPVKYNDDNYSDGFSSFHPHDCWRRFDMIYYGGEVWEAFVKGDKPGSDAEIAVYLARNKAENTPSSKPTHYRVVEPGQTWAWSDAGDQRRPNLVRFASFRDKLFLYIAKTYDYNTGSILWQKQIDPIAEKDVDGTRWNPAGTNIYSNRPGSSTKSSRVIKGMVVKVMNDTLYIFFQYGGTRDLYLITSKDAITFSAPQKVYTFAGNDCLLNGDVVTRGSDGAPLLAFLTKDDASGTTAGTIKLWTFDPAVTTNPVSAVESTLPGHEVGSAGQFRDATLVAGDVAGCTPYGATNLQIWAIGWGSGNVYHLQYVFGADGKSGSFYPAGLVDTGSASSHVEADWRGYLASCMAPQQTADGSLQEYARVWWWGSTDTSDAHGRSLKYAMDYLQRLPSTNVDTSSMEYSPAWVLQGVIYGLPPYYPNGTEISQLDSYYKVLFGLEQSQAVSNSVTSEKTLSVSYKSEGILGIPSSSMGLGWSNAVQQTSSSTTTVTQGSTLEWSPKTKGSPPPEDGAQAWGVFFVPTITNDRYHVWAPDKTTDLDVELYYTYISSGKNLIDKVFDKTDPGSDALGAVVKNYWTGTAAWPNSKTYWDPQWTGSETLIASGSTDTYENILPPLYWSASSGSATIDRYIALQNTTEQSKKCTNTIDASVGAFGFSTSMSGSLSIGSSTATTFGQRLDVLYGLPGWYASQIDPDNPPTDYNDYLKRMDLYMYLLRAKTDQAFWIPDGAKANGMYGVENYPWCITWHVNHWESQGATDQHGTSGPSVAALFGNVSTDMARSVPGNPDLRGRLIARVEAIRAAHQDGREIRAAILLGALVDDIRARSGRTVPATSARYWLHFLRLARQTIMASDAVGPKTFATASSGRVGRVVPLRYRVTDDASRYTIATRVVVRNRAGKAVKRFDLGPRATGTWHSVKWRPQARGAYRFYVFAEDLAGHTQVRVGSTRVLVK